MYFLSKRILDLGASMVLAILLTPLFLGIVIAIWLENSGPIFFTQTRVGRHGKRFTIFKFRTLYPRQHRLTDPWAIVTPLGRILRRWGLDELPQLWNVIRGDMSLIGPRPTVPEQVARYGAYERKRLEVPPGITGWAQVHGRNAIDWPTRIKLDIDYVHQASLGLDVEILWRTPAVLLSGSGVYGPENVNPSFTSHNEMHSEV